MPDLIRELQQSKLKSQQDLAHSLILIQQSVEQRWAQVSLPDFTDHGTEHSRRVAEYADLLATIRPLHSSLEVTLEERFLLSAAAWLHDIGMQDKRVNQGDPQSGVAEDEEIRKTHAKRSQFLIKEGRLVTVGLPANELMGPQIIALLALAHSTSTYLPALEQMEAHPMTFLEKPIRMKALAALLLMADELDLHYKRTPVFDEMRPISDESAAHWLKHECVQGAELRNTKGGVEVIVKLIPPTGMDDDDVQAVTEWIVGKLQQQIALTGPALDDAFQGTYFFSRRISVSPPGPIDRTSLHYRPEVVQFVHRENSRSRLINHHKSIGAAVASIDEGTSVQLVGPIGTDKLDESGREDLQSAIAARYRAAGWTVLANAVLGVEFGATAASEIIHQWISDGGGVVPPREQSDEEVLRADAIEALEALVLGSPTIQYLIVMSGVDSSDADRVWLADALSRLSLQANVVCCVTTDLAFPMRADFERPDIWNPIDIGEVPPFDAAQFLGRYMRTDDAEINAKALRGQYLGLKNAVVPYLESLLP